MHRPRAKVAGGTFVSGGPLRGPKTTGRWNDWKEHACPREDCAAATGNPCRRYSAGTVGGKDIGGGYWKFLKRAHKERRDLANPPKEKS